MKLKSVSYYYVGGAFEGNLKRVHDRLGFDTYDAWFRNGYIKSQTETHKKLRDKMMLRVGNAVYNRGYKKIFYALNGQDPRDFTPDVVWQNISAMAPYWDRVVAVEAADEPKWSREETKSNVRLVRNTIAGLGLAPKPVGIMYTPEQSRNLDPETVGDPLTLAPPSAGGFGPDFIGLEAYCDRFALRNGKRGPWDMGAGANRAYVKQTFDTAVARMHPDMKLQITFQAFDRNGVFKASDGLIHQSSLVALNIDTWVLIKNADWSDRVDYLRMFNWGRLNIKNGVEIGSGAVRYFKLQNFHREMLTEIKSKGWLV